MTDTDLLSPVKLGFYELRNSGCDGSLNSRSGRCRADAQCPDGRVLRSTGFSRFDDYGSYRDLKPGQRVAQ